MGLDKKEIVKKFLRDLDDNKVNLVLKGFGLNEAEIIKIRNCFDRQYKYNPKGYLTAKEIGWKLSLCSFGLFDKVSQNMVEQAKSQVIYAMMENSISVPWYFVSKDLAEDLTLTDEPKEIPNRFMLPNLGLIVLPKKLITNETGDISFIAYKIFCPGDRPYMKAYCETGLNQFDVTFVGEKGYRVCWFAPDRLGCIYGGILGLIPSEFGLKLDQEKVIFCDDEEKELKETGQLSTFLVNILTYASQEGAVETDSSQQRKNIVKNNPNYKPNPLFIGKKYHRITTAKLTGKGAKKSIHYRRGFWRHQACGKNYEEHKWRLISPTIVGAK